MTFNQPITIYKKTITKDSIGNLTETETAFVSCGANVNGLWGDEFWRASELGMQSALNFTIRYFATANQLNTTDYRIKWNNDFYEIKGIDNVQFRNRSIVIKAVKMA